jgi:AraC-like DNA-binding protein
VTVIVDTATAAPHDPFISWDGTAGEASEPVALRAAAGARFHGRVEEFRLGSVKLWRLSSDRAHVRRDVALIRSQDPEHLQVMMPTGDRPAGARSGWSTSSTVDARSVWSGIILGCPVAMLGPQADRVDRQLVLRFDGTSGPGFVLRQYLLATQAALEQDALAGCERSMGEAALDLVRAVCIRPQVGPDRPAAALRRQVLEHVDEHLGEPGLSTASIAQALFISRSQLYRVFQEDGTTITRWIRHRRLERCRSDLLDPSLAHESIFAIAGRWGFVSQAHFSRIFRAAYGCSPREMRQRA